MDIIKFNKELGTKIAIAKRFEKKGDIKAAIQEWVDISEMAINFSKSPKLDASFKNMIINRTQGIFAHIKELKAGQLQKEVYIENLDYLDEEATPELVSEIALEENKDFTKEKVEETSALNQKISKKTEITKDSEFRNLPKGFKEIQPSEDFTIITPHDDDFVKKQRAKAEENILLRPKEQEPSEEDIKQAGTTDFEQPKDGKTLICFACGYDQNGLNDKVCKNCGTNLN